MASQFGQDFFVLEVLGGLREGFFLDSGAYDGVRVSNTQLLEVSFAWRGICVEPNTDAFSKLVKNRRCYCVNCCLYDRQSTVEFVEQASVLGGILDEYHPAHLKYAKASYQLQESADGRPPTTRKIARTVLSVLQECHAPSVIDYWSLDTEGSELKILQSFPFDRYSFRVLTVEHNFLPIREEIKKFLEPRGYRRIRTLEIDDCYVRDVDLPHSSWRSSAWKRL